MSKQNFEKEILLEKGRKILKHILVQVKDFNTLYNII